MITGFNQQKDADQAAGDAQLRFDCHVHVMGDGSSGSGCWLKLAQPYHRILARYILRTLGLPQSALKTGLDAAYRELLIKLVSASDSIDVAVLLAHELVHGDDGVPLAEKGSFYVPNEYVLSIVDSNPGLFVAGISIHPGRADALDELERCIQRGAGVLKLLPNCQNLNCSDPRYKKFWKRLAEAEIPFLAHTGGELSVPQVNRAFADPATLQLPLECGVKVIAAHSGTSSHLFDPNYVPTFLKMMERFPNLYGDNSALNSPFRSKYFRELLAPAVQRRIVHGSDLPIPISGFWSAIRGQIRWSDHRACRAIENALERDARIKSALGFNSQTFTRLGTLLPKRVVERVLQSRSNAR